jgi:hypothetical protein
VSYTPVVNFNRLTLYLGLAATGKATGGSVSLTNVSAGTVYNPGSWTFEPSDEGMPIAIVGGGPVNALMPAPYFVQGSLFHTTIASYVSPTEVTLTDAPDTSIYNTGFATVVLYRPCPMASDVASVASGALQFQYDSSIAPGTSDTLQFTTFNSLAGDLGTDNQYIDRFGPPQLGQPVYLVSEDTGDVFGGYIDSLTTSSLPGVPGTPFCWSALCTSWTGIAKRRVVPPANPQTFTDVDADVVFTTVVLDYLKDDGVDVSVTSGLPQISLACAVGANVGQLLDQVVSLLTTADTAYYWTTDAWRTFILATRTATAAPWNVANGDDLFAGQTPYSQSITATHNQMANTSFAIGSAVLLNTLNATINGNGTAVTFNLPEPVGAAPTITLNGSPQTVGVLGVDTGMDWYWAQGSAVLTQATGATVLVATDVLLVVYTPESPAIAQDFNVAGLQQAQAVEATSGEYDHSFDVSQPIWPADLLAMAAAYEIEYGLPAQTVSFYTLRPGLAVGQLQTIDLPEAGVSGTFLIATIQMTTMENVIVWQYTAFGGANIGNAITALTQFINRQQGIGSIVTPSTPITGTPSPAVPGNNAAGYGGDYLSHPPLSFPESVAAGDLLWVAQNSTTTQPTDTQNNTYLPAITQDYPGFFNPVINLWYAIAIASGANAVTESAGVIAIGKISGIDPTHPIDTTGGGNDTPPTITVGQTGNVVVTAYSGSTTSAVPTVTAPEVIAGYFGQSPGGLVGAAVATPAAGSFTSSLVTNSSQAPIVSVSFALAPATSPPVQTTDVLVNPQGDVTHTGPLTAGLPVLGNGDADIAVGVAGQLVPAGGTTGQSLVKIDDTDYATEWSNAGSGTVTNANTLTAGYQILGDGGAEIVAVPPTHSEPLTDGDSNFIFANGDCIVVLGVPD